MKLRIKDNALRIRLTKTEVQKLASEKYLEAETVFPTGNFVYALRSVPQNEKLSALIEGNKITMQVAEEVVTDWPDNNIIGFDTKMPLPAGKSLSLLLEKDFVCLDETSEDQSDNYENPNKTC